MRPLIEQLTSIEPISLLIGMVIGICGLSIILIKTRRKKKYE